MVTNKALPIFLIVLSSCQPYNTAKQFKASHDGLSPEVTNTVPTSLPSNPTITYDNSCSISQDHPSNPLQKIIDEWDGPQDGKHVFVVGIFKIQIIQPDSSIVYYNSPIQELSTMNEDIKYRLWDRMEEAMLDRPIIIDKCCKAFTSYKAASNYIHSFDKHYEISFD